MSGKSLLNVQYGCGWSSAEGWLNFDSSPTLRLERLPLVGRFIKKNSQRFPENVQYGDVVKGLPVETGSVKFLYCSHVLEHLALEDFRIALTESYRVLAAGGIFRMVLPDLEREIENYRNSTTEDASIHFLESTILGVKSRPRGLRSFFAQWLGGSKHLWMWDFKSIRKELQAAGFSEIRRAYYGDSHLAEFDAIEEEGRWTNQLGVHSLKLEHSK